MCFKAVDVLSHSDFHDCIYYDFLTIARFLNSKTPMSMFKENVPRSPSSASEKPKDSKDSFKMCALCDFKFTLFKRQHHCRLCDAVCCDECSKKKAIVEETQVYYFMNISAFNNY